MKLTRERKIFVGVLALAVAALGIDQLFLAPRGASAGPVLPAAAVPVVPVQAGDVRAETPTLQSLGDIAKRIRSFSASGHEVTDAFSVPEAWDENANDAPEAEEQTPRTVDSLRLSAVLPQGEGLAIINGTSIRVGDTIPGTSYRLLRVGVGLAVITDGKRAYQIRMDDARYMSSDP